MNLRTNVIERMTFNASNKGFSLSRKYINAYKAERKKEKTEIKKVVYFPSDSPMF